MLIEFIFNLKFFSSQRKPLSTLLKTLSTGKRPFWKKMPLKHFVQLGVKEPKLYCTIFTQSLKCIDIKSLFFRKTI